MIEICEVGPRDGLQNEKVTLSVEDRVQLITQLVESGLKKIEAVSFVNPKVVPQMANPEEVMQQVPRQDGVRYAGLVLSKSGIDRALNTDVDDIHLVLAASSTFNLKNARRTAEQSLAELLPFVSVAKRDGRGVTAVIGTAFGCPFEGQVPTETVFNAVARFLDAGADGITLADTTGMANPAQVANVVRAFTERFPTIPLGLHFHNTRGLGIANLYAGYLAGVTRFDTSIAGLGGCPFAPLSVGNVCTEDVVHMFDQMGISIGAELETLLTAARFAEEKVQHDVDSYVLRAGPQPAELVPQPSLVPLPPAKRAFDLQPPESSVSSRFEKFKGFGGQSGFGLRPVILVIDFINGFTDPDCSLGSNLDEEVTATRTLIDAARPRGIPIIFTTVIYEDFREGGHFIEKVPALRQLVPESPLVEVDERLGRDAASDPLIVKKFASAFFGTNLQSLLTTMQVDTVIVTGCTSSGCVRATSVDALQHGYRVVVPRQCVGDRSRAAHEANLYDIQTKYGDVIDLDSVLSIFAQRQ